MKSEDLIKNALDYYDNQYEKYEKFFKIKNTVEIVKSPVDITNSYIKFFNEKKNLYMKSNIQLMGNYYVNDNLFIWSWALPQKNKNLTYLMRKVLMYGLDISQKNNDNIYLKSILTTSRLHVRNLDELMILRSLSLYLTKKDYLYWQEEKEEKVLSLYILYNIKTDIN